MRRTLKLIVIPAGKPAGAPPEPGPDVEIEAASDDALLAASHEAIAKRGLRARALSFTPTGLVAYAEAGRDTPDASHAADERLQTILKAHVVGATVQDPASRPAGRGHRRRVHLGRRARPALRSTDKLAAQVLHPSKDVEVKTQQAFSAEADKLVQALNANTRATQASTQADGPNRADTPSDTIKAK